MSVDTFPNFAAGRGLFTRELLGTRSTGCVRGLRALDLQRTQLRMKPCHVVTLGSVGGICSRRQLGSSVSTRRILIAQKAYSYR
jgi:hypothetical protein